MGFIKIYNFKPSINIYNKKISICTAISSTIAKPKQEAMITGLYKL